MGKVLVFMRQAQAESDHAAPGELTGRHFCTKCRAETDRETYFRTDHVCSDCNGDARAKRRKRKAQMC